MAAQEQTKIETENAARYIAPTVQEEARLTSVTGASKVTDVPN